MDGEGGLRRFVLVMAVHALLGTLVGGLAGLATLWLDSNLEPPVTIPIANAHALVTALIGAVLTIAVFTLWMRTVVVGLIANQVSPRIASSYLDDRFQRSATGGMVAALVYLVILAVGFPEVGGSATAPFVSSVVAVLVAVAALVTVLIAMRHAVSSLSPPVIVRGLTDEIVARLELPRWPDDPPPSEPIETAGLTRVRSRGLGWVTNVDHRAILDQLDPDGVAVLNAEVGDFVAAGDVLALVGTDDDQRLDAVRGAVRTSRTRDTSTDLAYALQQLVDVVSHATAPASQDTSTALEALTHLRSVLRQLLARGTATRCLEGPDGRWVISHAVQAPVDHLRQVAERLRGSATSDPVVAATVLRTFELLTHNAREIGDDASASLLDDERRRLVDAMEHAGFALGDWQQ